MERIFYEMTDRREEAELSIGKCLLKKTALSPEEQQRIAAEAEGWQVLEQVEYTETLFWHDDDERSGGYRVLHSPGEYVLRDGHFYGVLLRFSDESGFGMSSSATARIGVICPDGSAFGDTVREISRSSAEVDREGKGVFSLVKK